MDDELWKEVDDYIFSWELGKRKSGTLNARISSPSLIGSSFRVLCMMSIIDLVAEWVSFKDLLRLHALSSTAPIRFDEQVLNSLVEQNWAVMSDEWADFMFGSERDGKRLSRYWVEKEEEESS